MNSEIARLTELIISIYKRLDLFLERKIPEHLKPKFPRVEMLTEDIEDELNLFSDFGEMVSELRGYITRKIKKVNPADRQRMVAQIEEVLRETDEADRQLDTVKEHKKEVSLHTN